MEIEGLPGSRITAKVGPESVGTTRAFRTIAIDIWVDGKKYELGQVITRKLDES